MQQRRDHVALGVAPRYQNVSPLQRFYQRVTAHIQLVPEQVDSGKQLFHACQKQYSQRINLKGIPHLQYNILYYTQGSKIS